MNRYTLLHGSEDALLRRAEHCESIGETSEAVQYRRLAQSARRVKLGSSKITGHRKEI